MIMRWIDGIGKLLLSPDSPDVWIQIMKSLDQLISGHGYARCLI
jgi:hypothetical protein